MSWFYFTGTYSVTLLFLCLFRWSFIPVFYSPHIRHFRHVFTGYQSFFPYIHHLCVIFTSYASSSTKPWMMHSLSRRILPDVQIGQTVSGQLGLPEFPCQLCRPCLRNCCDSVTTIVYAHILNKARVLQDRIGENVGEILDQRYSRQHLDNSGTDVNDDDIGARWRCRVLRADCARTECTITKTCSGENIVFRELWVHCPDNLSRYFFFGSVNKVLTKVLTWCFYILKKSWNAFKQAKSH